MNADAVEIIINMKIRTKGNLHCYSKVLELFLEGVNNCANTYSFLIYGQMERNFSS